MLGAKSPLLKLSPERQELVLKITILTLIYVLGKVYLLSKAKSSKYCKHFSTIKGNNFALDLFFDPR
jgi:hypothetical protein